MRAKFASDGDSGNQAKPLVIAALSRRLMCTIHQMGSSVNSR